MAQYSDPTIVVDLQSKKKVKPASWYLLASAILCLGAVGYYFFQSAQLDTEIEKTNGSVASLQKTYADFSSTKKDLETLSSQASNLDLLFAGQKQWPKVLDLLQLGLYPDMVVTSLQLRDTGEVILAGYTRDYTDYAKIFLSFTNDNAKKFWVAAKPGGVTKLEENKEYPNLLVQFAFSLTLSPSILNVTKYNYKTVQDSITKASISTSGSASTSTDAESSPTSSPTE